MPNEMCQFMVNFTLPAVLSDRFTEKVPEQRAVVNTYFAEGKLVSYAVSLEKAKSWAVFNAETETDVIEMVRALPLTRYMRYEICPLTFYNIMIARMPLFSVN